MANLLSLPFIHNVYGVEETYMHAVNLDYGGYEYVLEVKNEGTFTGCEWGFQGNDTSIGIKFYAFESSEYTTFEANVLTYNTSYALSLATYLVLADGSQYSASGIFNYTSLTGTGYYKFTLINDDASNKTSLVAAYIDPNYLVTESPPSISFGFSFILFALFGAAFVIMKIRKKEC